MLLRFFSIVNLKRRFWRLDGRPACQQCITDVTGSYFVTSVMHYGHYGRDETGRFLAYYGQHNHRSTYYFRSKYSFSVCHQPRFRPIVIG